MKKAPRTVTVGIDRRERDEGRIRFPEQLLWFPRPDFQPVMLRVRTKKLTLKTGDYTVLLNQRNILIEKKGGLLELAHNLLTDDWVRQRKCFERMAKFKGHRVLLLEGNTTDYDRYRMTPALARRKLPDPRAVMDALWAASAEFGLSVVIAGKRSTTKPYEFGERVLRLMLGACNPEVEVAYRVPEILGK